MSSFPSVGRRRQGDTVDTDEDEAATGTLSSFSSELRVRGLLALAREGGHFRRPVICDNLI